MTWFAASLLIAMRKVGAGEGPLLAYENVVLIEAPTAAEATRIAAERGATEAAVDDGFTLDDVPAEKWFVGVRKLINISNPHPLDLDADRPVSGTEITYSLFSLPDEAALRALATGDPVDLTYVE